MQVGIEVGKVVRMFAPAMYMYVITPMMHSVEYHHPCTVNVSLHATIEECTEDITDFCLDLVSPVEYLFRKFSANEFGKPQYSKLTFTATPISEVLASLNF